MKTVLFAGAMSLAALAVAPASAVTFAAYTPISTAPNVSFTGTASGSGTLSTPEGSKVTFRFLDPSGTTTVFDTVANFTLNIMTGAGAAFMGTGFAPVISGTEAFTSLAPVTFNGHTGTNLLTAIFSGGNFTGQIGGQTATYGDTAPPQTVTFTSSFFNFSGTTARDLTIGIDAISPALTAFSGPTLTGTANGLFGADSLIGGGGQSGTPEPAAWAMFIVGFGLVGAVGRRRKTSTYVAA